MRIFIKTHILTDKSKVFDVVIRGDTGEELSLPCGCNEEAARILQAGLVGLIEIYTTETAEGPW